jgi:hypothetical protein
MAAIKLTTTFEPMQMKSRLGWYVLVAPVRGQPRQLGGFNNETEAKEWITRKSAAWLKDHKDLL